MSAEMTRRALLGSTAIGILFSSGAVNAERITGAVPWVPDSARAPKPVLPGPYVFFSPAEAATIEAIVDRIIPEDERGAGGKNAGCAVFIDRQLAGPYGRGDGLYLRPPFMPGTATQGYQNVDAPAARYRAGLKTFAAHISQAMAGKTFDQLPTGDQDTLLKALEAGKLPVGTVNGPAFFELVLQNTMEGYFADPVYGGNRDMVGWKLIGFPGTRYDYRDWIDRHNEPYPLPPVGIMGRPAWSQKG